MPEVRETSQSENLTANEPALEASRHLLNDVRLITIFLRVKLSSALGSIVGGFDTLHLGKAIQFGDSLTVYEKPHTFPDDPKKQMKKDRCFQIGKGGNKVTLITGICKDGTMTGTYLMIDGEEYNTGENVDTGDFHYINLDPKPKAKDNTKIVDAPTFNPDDKSSKEKGDPVKAALLLANNKVGKSYHTHTKLFRRPHGLGPQAYETPESLAARFPEHLIGFAQAVEALSPTHPVDKINAGYLNITTLTEDIASSSKAENASVVDNLA